VPVIDQVLVPAPQTRQPLQTLLGIPDIQVLGIESHLDHFSDQPARHRVRVSLDMEQAAAVHPTAQPSTCLQPQRRQGPQDLQLLDQALVPTRVKLAEQLSQEIPVLVPASEVSAVAQQQRLLHCLLEPPVPLFDVAVLVAVACLDLLAQQPIMLQ
jgi:hypothetical protein